jgi:hypothetical protein
MSQATEPSDVIWENIAVPKWLYFCKRMFTIAVTGAILMVSLALILTAKDEETKADALYPTPDCSGCVEKALRPHPLLLLLPLTLPLPTNSPRASQVLR